MKWKATALKDLKTWELVALSKERKAIRTKQVYDYNRDGQGNIIRAKVRLVAKEFTQVAEENFFEGFDPVSKYATIRFLLEMSVQLSWKRKRIDIRNTFLNVNLLEKLYVVQLKRFEMEVKENNVNKLKKALYGLK